MPRHALATPPLDAGGDQDPGYFDMGDQLPSLPDWGPRTLWVLIEIVSCVSIGRYK